MLGRKSEDGDLAIDGPDSITERLLSKARTAPPFVIYGGLLGFAALFAVVSFVLVKTFDYSVIILLFFAIFAMFGAGFFYDSLSLGLLVGLGVWFAGGVIIAYVHIRAFALLDRTLTPALGSAVDERWTPLQLSAWIELNVPAAPLQPAAEAKAHAHAVAERFARLGVTGAQLLEMTEDRLLALPLDVSDGVERAAVLAGAAKGRALSEKRRKAGGRTVADAAAGDKSEANVVVVPSAVQQRLASRLNPLGAPV